MILDGKRLTESQRLKLHATMEHEEDDCASLTAELDTNALAPPLSLPPPPAAEANTRLQGLAAFISRRDFSEEDEVTKEAIFV